MSWDTYALHAYAVEVQNFPLRDEIKVLLNDNDEDDEYEERYRDIDDVLEDLHNGFLDCPVYDKLNNAGWEFFFDPGVSKYIGYSAVMPYEQPSMTKEEMIKKSMILWRIFAAKNVRKKINQIKFMKFGQNKG